MMKTIALVALSLALLVSSAFAQDYSKTEVFVGYSFMYSGTLDGLGSNVFAGFDIDGLTTFSPMSA